MNKNFTLIKKSFPAIIAMGVIVWVSNFLVVYPINDWLTYAAFTYPFSFLVTDLINRFHGVKAARIVVCFGFGLGVFLSLGGDVRIAVASGTAFFVTQLLDIYIFDRLRHGIWWHAPFISSVIAGILDTILFWSIGFYDTGTPWVTWAFGDGAVKMLMVAIALTPYSMFVLKEKNG